MFKKKVTPGQFQAGNAQGQTGNAQNQKNSNFSRAQGTFAGGLNIPLVHFDFGLAAPALEPTSYEQSQAYQPEVQATPDIPPPADYFPEVAEFPETTSDVNFEDAIAEHPAQPSPQQTLDQIDWHQLAQNSALPSVEPSTVAYETSVFSEPSEAPLPFSDWVNHEAEGQNEQPSALFAQESLVQELPAHEALGFQPELQQPLAPDYTPADNWMSDVHQPTLSSAADVQGLYPPEALDAGFEDPLQETPYTASSFTAHEPAADSLWDRPALDWASDAPASPIESSTALSPKPLDPDEFGAWADEESSLFETFEEEDEEAVSLGSEWDVISSAPVSSAPISETAWSASAGSAEPESSAWSENSWTDVMDIGGISSPTVEHAPHQGLGHEEMVIDDHFAFEETASAAPMSSLSQAQLQAPHLWTQDNPETGFANTSELPPMPDLAQTYGQPIQPQNDYGYEAPAWSHNPETFVTPDVGFDDDLSFTPTPSVAAYSFPQEEIIDLSDASSVNIASEFAPGSVADLSQPTLYDVSHTPEKSHSLPAEFVQPPLQSSLTPDEAFGIHEEGDYWQQLEQSHNAYANWDQQPVAGNQILSSPTSQGQFLDTVHQTIYPEDPFVDAESSFDDAASLLFPETAVPQGFVPPSAYDASSVTSWQSDAMIPDNEHVEIIEDEYILESFNPDPPVLPQQSLWVETTPTEFKQQVVSEPKYSQDDAWRSALPAQGQSLPPEHYVTNDIPVNVPDNFWHNPETPVAVDVAFDDDFEQPVQVISDPDPLVVPVFPQAMLAENFATTQPQSNTWEVGATDADESDWNLNFDDAEAAHEVKPLEIPSAPIPSVQQVNVTPIQDDMLAPPVTSALSAAPVNASRLTDEEALRWGRNDLPPVKPPVIQTAPPEVAPPVSTPQVAQLEPKKHEELQVLQSLEMTVFHRLLLVHHQGHYALMSQVGPEEDANITVLKLFPHNPLGDLNEFVAVKEGQSANKEMFIVKLGNWQGLIAVDADRIKLQADLG